MKKIVPHNIEEMSRNSICQESPGKHPGNTRETPGKHPGKVHLLIFCIKGAGLERKRTSLAILMGILNKEKEKK